MSISVTDNINSFNVSNVLNVSNISNHYTLADDRSEILGWLSPLEPRIRHQDVRTRRADNVGEWLLQTGEFQRWCDGDWREERGRGVLFCCGDPGVGKTYLSSLVVDKLCDMAGERNIGVSCFYVDFAAREEQSPTNMLGSLLKQIVGGLEKIPDEICRMFQDHKKVIGGRGLRVDEIVKMLQAATSLQPTFICIDALDECVERHRPEILDSLRQILEKSPNTRIFLTGRRHIGGEIDRHLGERTTVLSIKPKRDDIVGYIRMRLNKDTSRDRIDSSLEDEIIKSIIENIPETFLLISLTMDAILEQTTVYGRRRKLRAMTQGSDLKDVYVATIERIKELGGEKTRLGISALMWISHSERLLQLDEILHALAVEIGSTDLNAENIPSVETLLSCCLGLLTIDKKASTVRLIHFTLQEYLNTSHDLFGPTHSLMAETCLAYLNSQTIKDISSMPLALPRSAPFLKYSSLYWGVHARREASKDVVSLALQFSNQIETHISTRLLLEDLKSKNHQWYHRIPDGPLIGFTGLHCASIFGIAEIATSLVDQPNCNLNKRDCLGITPLIWAAICGQEEVARLLLERQTISPDKLDRDLRRTALSWAAVMGHEEIVRLLLRRASTKPDGTDGWWGRTPRVVKKVRRRRYVNPNRSDKYGQTPIQLAAGEGNEGAVKLLLGRSDVKPDMPDDFGQTPLSSAAGKGHDGVVQLLLGREGVTPDMPDKHRRTPLSWAAGKGRDGVVMLLLERENVNPDTRDNDGQTPLLWAVKHGHDGVVGLLLGREDVNPNMSDNDGQTPLSWAVKWECGGAAVLLLGREDINPNVADNNGRTPLSWAAMNWNDREVGLLVGREDVNLNMPDNDGRTPLLWAARHGHDGAVKILLEREDINPNMPDNNGRTPLSWAARNGHVGVVKLLLRREDVNPDMANKDGLTPLSLASEKPHEEVVKLLQARRSASPDPTQPR